MTDTKDYEKKYADVFKMARAMVSSYYKNYSGFYKKMSLDKEDIAQEIMLIVYQSLELYELKYLNEKKVNARYFVRLRIHGKMYNTLRDYTHKMFMPLSGMDDEENTEEESDFIPQHPSPTHNCEFRGRSKMALKASDPLSETDIEDLIKKCSKTEMEYNIFYGKIVEKRTFEELQEMYNLPNRMNVNYLYQNVLKRMKSQFKSLDELKVF